MSEKKSDSTAYAIGEMLFILLPFIVMLIIYTYENKLSSIIYEPEWSLASSVMFGQSVIKFIHTITKSASKKGNRKFFSYTIGTIFSVLIVLGLVPSLIILALVFISKEPQLWLITLQIIYFFLASIVFTCINILHISIEEDEN